MTGRQPASDPFGSPPGSGERARIAAEKLPTVGRWPGTPLDVAFMAALAAVEESDIVAESGLVELAVRTAAPILLADYCHDGPDGHCVCYHLVCKQLDELQATVDAGAAPALKPRPEHLAAVRAIDEVGG
jgi:hypothetical protein